MRLFAGSDSDESGMLTSFVAGLAKNALRLNIIDFR